MGFDRALEHFATACDADDDCLLARDRSDPRRHRRRSTPRSQEVGSFPTDDPARVLTPGELTLGVFAALYSESYWPFLVRGLYVAETDQDGSILQVLADSLLGAPATTARTRTQPRRTSRSTARTTPSAAPPTRSVRWRRRGRGLRATSPTSCGRSPAASGSAAGRPADHRAGHGRAADPGGGHHGRSGDPVRVGGRAGRFPRLRRALHGGGRGPHGVRIDRLRRRRGQRLPDRSGAARPRRRRRAPTTATPTCSCPPGESEVEQIVALLDCLRDEGLDVPEIGLDELHRRSAGGGVRRCARPRRSGVRRLPCWPARISSRHD